MGNMPSIDPVTNLHMYLDRNAGCDGMDITQEQCDWAHQWWRDWYKADLAYGLPVVYFFCAGIGLFTFLNVVHQFRQTRAGTILLLDYPVYRKLAAFSRGVGLRQSAVGNWVLLPTGITIVILATIVFTTVLCFAPKPYYWPSMDFGSSPPLATRAGWMVIAMLPFQVIFASKWNPITQLTGISHEKLQPLHRWTGWIMYICALLHTFPFIVVDIQNGMMEEMWEMYLYKSGVAALVPQTFLVVMSIGCIRNRYYETFKSLHFLMAAFFILMLFVHCEFTMTSADYFIGFAVVYLGSLLIRWGKSFKFGFAHRAKVQVLEDRMIKITIPTTTVNWAPGQHMFFRFRNLGIHSWTSHPFTIASIPTSGEIEVYARIGRGLTKRLAEVNHEVPVLLDGAYGGVSGKLEAYDKVLLIGGGSGGSFILALMRHLALALPSDSSCKEVTVVYATRSKASLSWFKSAFEETLAQCPKHVNMKLNLHVTAPGMCFNDDDDDNEKGKTVVNSSSSLGTNDKAPAPVAVTHAIVSPGRPKLAETIHSALNSSAGTVGIAVCGPVEMTLDARNCVARGQGDILLGRSSSSECFLHTETFGW
ncbi:hypothetical protein T439DRAFT_357978 [Meredithblackwellia eburnea MCA 4105]